MTLLSKRPFAARACLALGVGIVLPACDHRPMHINPVYDPSAPENAAYTPRRGPHSVTTYALPDKPMLRHSLARNPSRADIARDACRFSENQRMSPDGNCALAQ